MASYVNPNVKQIRSLRQQGYTSKEIHEITGVSRSYIDKLICTTATVNEKAIDPQLAKSKLTYEQQVQWTKYVNIIRVYCGKEPFPLPVMPGVKK